MQIDLREKKLIWLAVNLFMVISMVIIGGITRLTDSGLSMTNWNLVQGIVPPLNDFDWKELFDNYKLYPEYKLKNASMTLLEFKKIFFWEYLHRIWGRLIGFTFFVPLILIWFKGGFQSNEKKLLSILALLGFFQAFMGWYMVKSGLIDKPDVSHFRLSAHLLTAFLIYSVLLYYFWTILSNFKLSFPTKVTKRFRIHNRNFCKAFFLSILTISAGALVSGTDAGLSYNNFPLMGEGFFPPVLYSTENLKFKLLFNDQGFLQFTHRVLATITLLFVLLTTFKAYKDGIYIRLKIIFYSLFILLIFQYFLGVLILKLHVPILLGLMHQAGGLLILSLIVISICESKYLSEVN